ncbi:MAG: hypothetical protein GX846_04550 [Deltaproteobacteria bacterium]|nr:hypothetical protein [Deltaproteobacteria bacterium]
MELLVKEGLERPEAANIISSLAELFDPRKLRQGQEITLRFESTEASAPLLFTRLSLLPDPAKEIQVTRLSEKEFISKEVLHRLEKKIVMSRAVISTSLYNAALDAEIPMEILVKMIRAFSYDIDFQRDIQNGDSF